MQRHSAVTQLIFKGKSHLSASFIARMRSSGKTILFTFLSFQHQETTTVVSVIHSLIFQLLYKHQHLRPALIKAYENDYTELQSYVEYNQQLLTDLLQCIEAPYIVIDGLDEIAEKERQFLLKRLLQISNQCPDLKVLISSREDKDISTALHLKALSLPIRQNMPKISKHTSTSELRIGWTHSTSRMILIRLLKISCRASQAKQKVRKSPIWSQAFVNLSME